MKVLAIVGLAIIALGVIFALNNQDSSSAGTPADAGPGENQVGSSAKQASNGAEGSSSSDAGLAGKYAFQVGKPGSGEKAPPIQLPSTDGGTFDLSSLCGQTVLLYFQEGIMCQPCWDQLKDIEAKRDEFKALGIDRIVSITGDPLPALKQKVGYEGLTTPVLSDRGLVASKTYDADQYGMMGGATNGHSFVVVNEDGVIEWRADYGGDPDYTMYVPVPNLLAVCGRASRQRVANPMEVLLLTEENCAYCQQAKETLDRLAAEYDLSISAIDLRSPEGQDLAARGGVMFPPGILIDGQAFSYGRLSERKFRREVERRLG